MKSSQTLFKGRRANTKTKRKPLAFNRPQAGVLGFECVLLATGAADSFCPFIPPPRRRPSRCQRLFALLRVPSAALTDSLSNLEGRLAGGADGEEGQGGRGGSERVTKQVTD